MRPTSFRWTKLFEKCSLSRPEVMSAQAAMIWTDSKHQQNSSKLGICVQPKNEIHKGQASGYYTNFTNL